MKSFEVRIENPHEESEGLQILHIGATSIYNYLFYKQLVASLL